MAGEEDAASVAEAARLAAATAANPVLADQLHHVRRQGHDPSGRARTRLSPRRCRGLDRRDPRHAVQAQGGWFNNGIGIRASANWRSGTKVDSLTGDNLHFSPLATFDLRLFANPGDIPEVVVKHPWLRATQVRFEITNIFDAKPKVHDAAGNVPLNYQADLLDPIGRTVGISIRKLFLPPASFFRREIQQRQQQQQTQPTG